MFPLGRTSRSFERAGVARRHLGQNRLVASNSPKLSCRVIAWNSTRGLKTTERRQRHFECARCCVSRQRWIDPSVLATVEVTQHQARFPIGRLRRRGVSAYIRDNAPSFELKHGPAGTGSGPVLRRRGGTDEHRCAEDRAAPACRCRLEPPPRERHPRAPWSTCRLPTPG